MARVNLAAYAAPGCNYPEYVSINREDNGKVSISVRGAPVYQGLDAQGINKYRVFGIECGVSLGLR